MNLAPLENKIPPPIVAAIVGAAMWASASWGPVVPLPAGVANLAPWILVVVALAFDGLALLAFRSARTTVDPLRPARASALVTTGVYRITRNPMYVGLGTLLLAWATHLAALVPFVGPAVFVAYVTRFQIVPEERELARIFGADYERYAARVRRWL
jgi:protein-S-isoprenylcysteine O-methyltransferase Ste14